MPVALFECETTIPSEPFEVATARVNEWRGRCLDAFTRAETAVTETLAALAGCGKRGARVTLPHLVGQRYQALADAIAPGGPFAAEGGASADALDRCQKLNDLRTMLCHGTCRVTLDRSGRWTVVMKRVTLKANQIVHDQFAVTEREAQALRDDATRASRELCASLASWRCRLSPA
jgi:hypothetical protein